MDRDGRTMCLDSDGDGICDAVGYTLVCGRASDLPAPAPLAGSAPIGRVIAVTDALLTLQAAVGSVVCPDCVCDVDSSGAITATEALLVLQFAVGQQASLSCPAYS